MPLHLAIPPSGLPMGPNSCFTVNHAREEASLPLSISISSMSSIIVIVIMFLISCSPDRYLGTHHRPDLPGPRGWPLLGNTLDIFLNRKRMLMRFHELGSYYGELFSVTLPIWGRTIIINHPEWLEHVKKGALYHNARNRMLILSTPHPADTVRYGKGNATLAIFAEFPGKRSAFGSEGADWRWVRKITQCVPYTHYQTVQLTDTQGPYLLSPPSILMSQRP